MTFAPEIEQAIVSIIWHEPDRCAEFLRWCDPAVHLIQPHLRHVLEAIRIAYSELGDVDFPVVAQIVRELGKFDECGGLEGLNAVYVAREPTVPCPNVIFDDYVKLLHVYAQNRETDPERPVYRYIGGRGTAWRNKGTRKSWQGDYAGEAIVRGFRYRIDLEVNPDADCVSVRLTPK